MRTRDRLARLIHLLAPAQLVALLKGTGEPEVPSLLRRCGTGQLVAAYALLDEETRCD